MKIREAFKLAMRTRSFWLMGVVSLSLVVITILVTLLSLRVTSINIPIHYSDYATQFFSEFNDKWYYLIAFIAFVVAVFVINLFLVAKMIAVGKRSLGMVVQFVTILVLLISLMILLNVYGIIKLRLAIQ
jgi:hypothetical protein